MGSMTSYLEVMRQAESNGEGEKEEPAWVQSQAVSSPGRDKPSQHSQRQGLLLCTILTGHQTPKLSVYTLLVKEEMTKSPPQQTLA